MKRVGLRELKNRLSEYVRYVRAGHAIEVTDRGEVVAELRPPGEPVAHPEVPPGLAALVRRGLVTAGGRNDPRVYKPQPRVLAPGELQRLLDEERGER